MKAPLVILAVLAFAGVSYAGVLELTGKTLPETKLISPRVLQNTVSPKFYQTLLISPIDDHVMIRAQLVGTKVFGERVIHPSRDTAFVQRALDGARKLTLAGDYRMDSQSRVSTVVYHMLTYKIADGTLMLSFANLDGAGGDQAEYYGAAKLEVLHPDGRLTEIHGPKSLDGKGLAIRVPGIKNNLAVQLKMERIPGPR